ncbi:class I SAM-dependent methyltransferase [Tropicimonas isoalkanivorans]|uniref:Methyltransferase domain-containing protein n=1 Tax=Tropicimonas isoalkanivorans TaxID=441112 RepID=A0A1I1ILQ6_9RHOB|nr:class I SAM-dependent methyltransferase [Tropicimonas isoalkanivorans]SFC37105.1 Methyltransferase domain-containing protein [Tropicimonas isoalkanivorans]
MDWEAFSTLHDGLDREGPGCADDVRWAVGMAGTHGEARVLDAGCGPGADTETLAHELPEAWIDAVDLHAPFAAATAARCSRFGPRVKAWQGDMAKVAGPYDLIWCAGAMYFLGVTEGLGAFRGMLTRAGRVAFSEPVLLSDKEPPEVHAFWSDYPQITDRAGVEDRIAAAGYRTLGTRLVIGAPWEAYYAPLERRIADLRSAGPSSALDAALKREEAEIAAWRAAPDRIAYLLSVVEPA